MRSALPLVAALLEIIAPFIYARSILKGKSKPHRTTRFVLLIITLLTFAAIFAQENYVAIWLAGASAFTGIVIFALSINYGLGGGSKVDILCLLIALVGIFLWQVTRDPVIALYFALLADFSGMIPALIKTYHRPGTEIWIFYMLSVVAASLTLIATLDWTIEAIAYPAYIFAINATMVAIIVSRRQIPANK